MKNEYCRVRSCTCMLVEVVVCGYVCVCLCVFLMLLKCVFPPASLTLDIKLPITGCIGQCVPGRRCFVSQR